MSPTTIDPSRDPSDGFVLQYGTDQGFHLLGVFDLPTPDDRGTERFSLDLGDFLMLVFEHWCPLATTNPPFVDAHAMAMMLGPAWASVWFPVDGRRATVTPLFVDPWLRIAAEAWPLLLRDGTETAIPLMVWPQSADPPDGDSRWIRVASPKTDTAHLSMVNLKLRPDKARGGRVRMEVAVNVDLFAPPLTRTGAIIRAFHRAQIQGWVEDLCFYYPPIFWQSHQLPETDGETSSVAIAERAAVRLLQRVEHHGVKPRDSRWLVTQRWLEWLQTHLAQKVMALGGHAATETTLTIVRQRLDAM